MHFVRMHLHACLLLFEQFEVTANYPLVWNDHQDWRVDFTACKAVVYLIFAHKDFFSGKMQKRKNTLGDEYCGGRGGGWWEGGGNKEKDSIHCAYTHIMYIPYV